LRRLLFIASPGHTGSTLLDLLLGGHPDVVALGEVQRLAQWASEADTRVCTCGLTVLECPFWTSVRDRIAQGTGEPGLALADFPLAVIKPVETLHRTVPKVRDIVRILGSRALWRAAQRVDEDSRREAQTSRHAELVYEAASELTGASVVVDSSKNPGTLKNRWLHDPERFRLLFQVRDGRAVARSQMRRDGSDMATAARDWRRMNINLLAMLASIPRRSILKVRYEDLCSEPDVQLRRISEFAGLETPPEGLDLRKSEAHNIGGNPMRFRKDEREIRLDERWRTDLDEEELAIFERVAGRLNRFLGYR